MAFTPLIDTTAIKANIAAFIQAVTGQGQQGQPVTWAYDFQQAAKPLKPYAVYKITGPRKIGGLDEIRGVQMTDDQGDLEFTPAGDPIMSDFYLVGEREYTVAIECASNDEFATELSTNLETALEQPQFVSILEANGYAVRGIVGVQDVTALLVDSTKYERRVILEFYFVATSTALYQVPVIKSAQGVIEGTPNAGNELQTPFAANLP